MHTRFWFSCLSEGRTQITDCCLQVREHCTKGSTSAFFSESGQIIEFWWFLFRSKFALKLAEALTFISILLLTWRSLKRTAKWNKFSTASNGQLIVCRAALKCNMQPRSAFPPFSVEGTAPLRALSWREGLFSRRIFHWTCLCLCSY